VGTTTNSLTDSAYTLILFSEEHVPVCVIKTILKRGFRLVRPALNSPQHGKILFECLAIGREEENGVVVRYGRKKGEGLV
jgi:hypothetical protein